ncbi:hypothetical protein LB505_009389 [Fusarium chuoi]|nr:hypothetical protein LB505_009389 [Fusarium chuoi]
MADRTGWQNFWWLNVAVTALSIVLGIFGFPETKWTRIDSIEAERGVNEIIDTTQDKPSHSHADAEKTVGTPQAQVATVPAQLSTPSKHPSRYLDPMETLRLSHCTLCFLRGQLELQ